MGRKDSPEPFLHPSQVKEKDDSSSASIQPSVRPPGPERRGRGRTVTAPPRSRPVAGSSPPTDSVNTGSLDGDNVENGIITLNNLVLKGGISISKVNT